MVELSHKEAKTLLACLIKLAKFEYADIVRALLKNDKGEIGDAGAADLRHRLIMGAASVGAEKEDAQWGGHDGCPFDCVKCAARENAELNSNK